MSWGQTLATGASSPGPACDRETWDPLGGVCDGHTCRHPTRLGVRPEPPFWTRPERSLSQWATNQFFAVGSVVKNFQSSTATFCWPLTDGCVPSVGRTSLHVHTRPSLRPLSPFVHKYGPQPSHGPLIFPLARWRTSHLTAKPLSYAYGSGLRFVVAYPPYVRL